MKKMSWKAEMILWDIIESVYKLISNGNHAGRNRLEEMRGRICYLGYDTLKQNVKKKDLLKSIFYL